MYNFFQGNFMNDVLLFSLFQYVILVIRITSFQKSSVRSPSVSEVKGLLRSGAIYDSGVLGIYFNGFTYAQTYSLSHIKNHFILMFATVNQFKA